MYHNGNLTCDKKHSCFPDSLCQSCGKKNEKLVTVRTRTMEEAFSMREENL